MYVKDMARMGRKLKDVILLDNSPISYIFQPENGMPIKNWYDDRSDRELELYCDILEMLSKVSDVWHFLPFIQGTNNNIDIRKAK